MSFSLDLTELLLIFLIILLTVHALTYHLALYGFQHQILAALRRRRPARTEDLFPRNDQSPWSL